MINFSRISFILLSVLLLSACATAPLAVKVGRDFDVDAFVAKIEQGGSTQDQVRSWLGEPVSVGINLAENGERYDEWTYYSVNGVVTDLSAAKVKMLQVKFDKTGVVRSYSWSASKQ
jgi:outer membrane protein assembly factor BamE (lipoprotein component of BamABCDE complex)